MRVTLGRCNIKISVSHKLPFALKLYECQQAIYLAHRREFRVYIWARKKQEKGKKRNVARYGVRRIALNRLSL